MRLGEPSVMSSSPIDGFNDQCPIRTLDTQLQCSTYKQTVFCLWFTIRACRVVFIRWRMVSKRPCPTDVVPPDGWFPVQTADVQPTMT